MGRAASAVPIAVVVEDEKPSAISPRRSWRRPISTSSPARAPRTALAVMRRHGPDVALLFTEMRLGGAMDGAALARTIERDWPDVRSSSPRSPAGPSPCPTTRSTCPSLAALDVLVQAERAVVQPVHH